MSRDLTSRGIQVLLAFLADHLTLARALRERRYADLHAAAHVASLLAAACGTPCESNNAPGS